MKRIILLVGIGFVLFISLVVVFKDEIAKRLVPFIIEKYTGIKLNVGKIHLGIFSPFLSIDNLTVFNPPNFTEAIMLNIPKVYIEYDLGAFFKKNIHLKKCEAKIKTLNIVQNGKGKFNLGEFVLQDPEPRPWFSPSKRTSLNFRIDESRLGIEKIVYKDYTVEGISPFIREIALNFDYEFKNVANSEDIVKRIVLELKNNSPGIKLLMISSILKI